MTIIHHPSDTTLAAYTAGTLDEARGLVVATHLSLCRECREGVRTFEHVDGALLESADPAEMSAGALERATARLDGADMSVRPAPVALTVAKDQFPVPLGHYKLGPPRWIGRGVQCRWVDIASDDDVRALVLRAAPGIRLPAHRHAGAEWTCVFEGAYRHRLGRFGAGDFDEADESVEHEPTVEPGVPCICLVALQGRIRLDSWIGRLIQHFTGL